MEALENKQDQIIEAAIKRFSHFGIAKTTMNEIAEDLSMSKALLYYYFPDKVSLIVDVVKVIFSEFLAEIEKKLSKAENIKEGLIGIVETRIKIGKKYYMMHVGDGKSDINLEDPRLSSIMVPFKADENKLIVDFLESGVKNKELKNIDCKNVAELLVDLTTGIWICELHVKCKVLIPTQEQFDAINLKNKQIMEIFYDGIRNHSINYDICNLFHKKQSKNKNKNTPKI